jgi:hypothetical protein
MAFQVDISSNEAFTTEIANTHGILQGAQLCSQHARLVQQCTRLCPPRSSGCYVEACMLCLTEVSVWRSGGGIPGLVWAQQTSGLPPQEAVL